jgi:hypothetical protein
MSLNLKSASVIAPGDGAELACVEKIVGLDSPMGDVGET